MELYLSVNHEGRVSLWDTERKALQGKEDGEIYLKLELTSGQERDIENASLRAEQPRRQTVMEQRRKSGGRRSEPERGRDDLDGRRQKA
jgi:hypothetical protein